MSLRDSVLSEISIQFLRRIAPVTRCVDEATSPSRILPCSFHVHLVPSLPVPSASFKWGSVRAEIAAVLTPMRIGCSAATYGPVDVVEVGHTLHDEEPWHTQHALLRTRRSSSHAPHDGRRRPTIPSVTRCVRCVGLGCSRACDRR